MNGNNEQFGRLNDPDEYFTFEGFRARYETQQEYYERLKSYEVKVEYAKDNNSFCKPGTVIKSIVERPVMFRKPIEQFFDVSEAIIIEH